MNTPPPSDPQEILESLTSLIPHLYHSLEAAIQAARSFFDERNEKPDPYLFPCLVRYHAKLLLREREQAADYEFDDLANNGLYLVFGEYPIRVLKSDDGRLPVPGNSKAKQEFYNQQLSFTFMPGSVTLPMSRMNLVVLWDTDSLWNLERLTLVCPKAGGVTRESVETHWEIQIPHPALLETAMVPTNAAGDLPMSLKSTAKRAKTNG